jgi:hypothetical protein
MSRKSKVESRLLFLLSPLNFDSSIHRLVD